MNADFNYSSLEKVSHSTNSPILLIFLTPCYSILSNHIIRFKNQYSLINDYNNSL